MDLAAKDLHVASLVEKALLALNNIAFRKTHDLGELGKQCAALYPSLIPLLSEAANLTDYAIVFRYLDAPREPDDAEAHAGLMTARSIYDKVSALMA